jgi:hypothetical protein
MNGFKFSLTVEQIIDAVKAHRDRCAECTAALPADFDRWSERRLKHLLAELLKQPGFKVMLAERYQPEQLAVLKNSIADGF